MRRRALVAYSTKGGGTLLVANLIGDALHHSGVEADVARADSARRIERYDAVLIGSQLRGTRWERESVAFLTKHKVVLGTRHVWLFQVGLPPSADTARLPSDVMTLARRAGAIGALTLVADPPDDHPVSDTSIIASIRNIEAVEQIAAFVADTVHRRPAV